MARHAHSAEFRLKVLAAAAMSWTPVPRMSAIKGDHHQRSSPSFDTDREQFHRDREELQQRDLNLSTWRVLSQTAVW
jgi:hypothetical protein